MVHSQIRHRRVIDLPFDLSKHTMSGRLYRLGQVASRKINQVVLASDDPFVRSANKGELVQVRPVGGMNSGVLENLQKSLAKGIQKYVRVSPSFS